MLKELPLDITTQSLSRLLPLGVACATCPPNPALAVATAARLAPHLLARAAETDQVGGFPTQEFA